MEEKDYMSLFRYLFDEYFRSLVILAYRYVNDWQAGEDIAQDVFISLWIKKEEVNFNDPIKPYLYRSIYNRSMNYLNSVFIRNSLEHPESIDEQINQELLLYNQYDTLLLHELAAEIESCVEKLPRQCRIVYQLSRQEHLRNKEIALRLNISEKAVEKHITKALCHIRTHLIEIGLMFCMFLF